MLEVSRAGVDSGRCRRVVARVGLLLALCVAAQVCVRPGASLAAGPDPAPDCGCGNVTTGTFSPPGAAVQGTDSYLVFTPDSYTGRTAVPLVVVTHGCNTTAQQMLASSDYDQLAERDGFIVLYPDDNDNVHPVKCWQFYNPANELRGQDDLARIVGMTDAVFARYRIDRQRVYEIGMSSGALITSDLAAAYPDIFTAVGIMAGGPYGADSCLSGADPTVDGQNPQLTTSVDGAIREEGPRKRVIPVIVLNGDADTTVNPLCDQLAVEQWLETDNLVIDNSTTAPLALTPSTTTPGQVAGGLSYQVLDYAQPSGCLILQHWIIHGMGHFWSGGSSNPADSAFTDPKGPSASDASWDFFSRYTMASTAERCADVSSAKPTARHHRQRRKRRQHRVGQRAT